MELQIQKIQALCELKKELDLPFVINARTCVYWLNIGGEEEKLAEAVRRGNAFAEAGADCVFVPGAMNQETARALASGIHAPLNLILNGVYHDFADLRSSVSADSVPVPAQSDISARKPENGRKDQRRRCGCCAAEHLFLCESK